MNYTSGAEWQWSQPATYVDKILHEAKAGDLPVEQPSQFEIVVNLRTAEALRLRFPPAVAGQLWSRDHHECEP